MKPPILQHEQIIPPIKNNGGDTLAHEENMCMAKLAEQAQRYEETVEFTKKVSTAMESEERNLLFLVYKNVIIVRRASWHIISSIEQKEESRGNKDHVSMIRDYISKIKPKLSNIYDGILKLLDTKLIPSATTSDSKVFYLKMKGEWALAMDSGEWEILSIEHEKVREFEISLSM